MEIQRLNLLPDHQKVGVATIAMESTSVCWIRVFEILEFAASHIQHVQKALMQMNRPLHHDVRDALYRVAGLNLTQIHGLGSYVALKLIAKCGTDLSRSSPTRAKASLTVRYPLSHNVGYWASVALSRVNRLDGGPTLVHAPADSLILRAA